MSRSPMHAWFGHTQKVEDCKLRIQSCGPIAHITYEFNKWASIPALLLCLVLLLGLCPVHCALDIMLGVAVVTVTVVMWWRWWWRWRWWLRPFPSTALSALPVLDPRNAGTTWPKIAVGSISPMRQGAQRGKDWHKITHWEVTVQGLVGHLASGPCSSPPRAPWPLIESTQESSSPCFGVVSVLTSLSGFLYDESCDGDPTWGHWTGAGSSEYPFVKVRKWSSFHRLSFLCSCQIFIWLVFVKPFSVYVHTYYIHLSLYIFPKCIHSPQAV